MGAADIFGRAAMAMAGALGVDATYENAAGGPPFAVRLVKRNPEDVQGPPGRGRITGRSDFMLPRLALGPSCEPQRGDLVGIGTEGGWKVETFQLDPTGSYFILNLLRQ